MAADLGAGSGRAPSRAEVFAVLEQVPDPEIPVLSVVDLGIVRDVEITGSRMTVSLAPTYTACPATEVIEQAVIETLRRRGMNNAVVRRVLSPPWTTDWITQEGRRKLAAYGIAPPQRKGGSGAGVTCPRCGSVSTLRVSEFGSTPCKASWRCESCSEPFEYFKCL